MVSLAPDLGALDASSPAEADRDLSVLHDHGHGAAPAAQPQHPLQLGGVLLDVDVLDLDMPPDEILTGGLRVRSGVLAENRDPVRHL